MHLKKYILCLAISLLAAACSESEDTYFEGTLSLPQFIGSDELCESTHTWSGGDFMRTLDRIALGTVTEIEVVQDFRHAFDECRPESIRWALKVHLSVAENFKGAGSTLAFSLNQNAVKFWKSDPMYKRDGSWYPSPDSPAIQLSENLGWSGESGIQVGQQLLVFLEEKPDGYAVQAFPMGHVVNGRLEFQGTKIPGTCIEYDDSLTRGITVSEISKAMAEPEMAPMTGNPYEASTAAYGPSYCVPKTWVEDTPEPEIPRPD